MTKHSQHKSEHDLTFLNRVELLRSKSGATWAEVGKMVGLSRTMLHHLRRGQHKPSQRTLARLEQAEMRSGLREAPAARKGIRGLLESLPVSGLRIEASDHDAGIVQVSVEFRRGSAPEGFGGLVPVKAPGAKDAAELFAGLLRDESVEVFLRKCLPTEYASEEFLNKLEPQSFLRLLHAALEMSLGVTWREKLASLPAQTSPPV
jgi:transcriptional regulator with XRE-family HTH domain